MRKQQWQHDVETVSEKPISPLWDSSRVRDVYIPLCSDECGCFDGKRCKILGYRPDTLCRIAVERMTLMLGQKKMCECCLESEAVVCYHCGDLDSESL